MLPSRQVVRLSTACSLVLIVLASSLPGANGRAIEPIVPRQGAAFGFGTSPPRITLKWKEADTGQDYLLQITRKAVGEEIVATYEIHRRNRFTFEAPGCGSFSWWVTGIDPEGQPIARAGEVRTFFVLPHYMLPDRKRSKKPASTGAKVPPKPGSSDADAVEVAGTGKQQLPDKRPPEKDEAASVWAVPGGDDASTVSDDPEVAEQGTAVSETSLAAEEEGRAALRFPSPPRPQAPDNGARIVAGTPRKIRLFWERVWGADAYEVELSPSGDFDEPTSTRRVSRPLLVIRKPRRGRTYWRVRALGSGGKAGEWSAVWKFDFRRLFDE